MEIYDHELHEKVLDKMLLEGIQDFSEAEIERVFADFDLPEKQYLGIIDVLISRGLTIEAVYERVSPDIDIDL
jgi:hypothetical protein